MLDQEIKIFEERLSDFLKDKEGSFVLIKGTEINFFKTEQEAVDAGIEKYGSSESSFLVREIIRERTKFDIPALSLGLIKPIN